MEERNSSKFYSPSTQAQRGRHGEHSPSPLLVVENCQASFLFSSFAIRSILFREVLNWIRAILQLQPCARSQPAVLSPPFLMHSHSSIGKLISSFSAKSQGQTIIASSKHAWPFFVISSSSQPLTWTCISIPPLSVPTAYSGARETWSMYWGSSLDAANTGMMLGQWGNC